LVADMVSKERDGKSFLTEADKHALREGWTPKDNNEVREFNRFNEGWQDVMFMEADAQTTYFLATDSLLRTIAFIANFRCEMVKKEDEVVEAILKGIDQEKVLNLVLKNLGLELDYTIYRYAWELADEKLRKDLLDLYSDADTERDYSGKEEIIADLFNGKDTLTRKDKEVFKKWLEVKARAKATIQELIDKGELKVEKREKVIRINKNIEKIIKGEVCDIDDGDEEIFRQTQTLITGESLYNLKGDFTFAKDFKKQVENFKVLGSLILPLRESRFIKEYSILLAFEILFKELSKIFRTDLTFRIESWKKAFKNDLWLLKREFLEIARDIEDMSNKSEQVYRVSSDLEGLLTIPFDLDKIKPDYTNWKIKNCVDRFKNTLQDDFKNPFEGRSATRCTRNCEDDYGK